MKDSYQSTRTAPGGNQVAQWLKALPTQKREEFLKIKKGSGDANR